MSTLYQRALGLSAVVLVAALVALVLSGASAASDREHLGALGVRGALDDAALAVAGLVRTRDPALADSARRALDRGARSARALPAADAARVQADLERYGSALARLRAALVARGVDEQSGAEGRFRERVHAVEDRVAGASGRLLVEVLQARRREKDFLLRGRPEYVRGVRRHVAAATAAARAELAPDEADAVAALLSAYEAGFLDLVRLTGEVEGLAAEIDGAAGVAGARADRLAEVSAARSRRYGVLSFAAVLLSAFVVGVGVLYQARGITRPVARLRDAAARVAQGEPAVRVPVEGPDEVRTLAAALNGVADYADRTAAAERDLAETQRFLSTVLGQAEEGVVVVDADYRIAYANPYAERLFGTPLEAVRGRRPDGLFPVLARAGRRAVFERALAGEVVHADDLEVVTGGRSLWTAATYAPLASAGGAAQGVVITVHDVTERVRTAAELRAAKEEAEAAARLKSAFLANMSHEIRTPLTGILGYADLLAEEAPPEVADLADVIQRSGRRLLDTLNSVLDLAQLESGTMELRSEAVDASAVLGRTAQLYAHAADQAGLDWVADIAPGVRVTADPGALARVVDNLASNALKFTPSGRVALRLRAEGDPAGGGAAVVEVADTGIGMSAAFQARMFDEFEQESDGHARTHEGNGLGLTIVRRLVDLMGGTLDVESAPGQGATFQLRLPLAAPVESAVRAAA